MITLKKQLLVASLFLSACWALRTSEGDGPGEAEQKRASAEVEQKEAVARNPQGQVVPFPRRILTFGEAAGRVTRGQNPAAWSFARGLATGATVPLEKRIAQLPIDAQTTIAQYLEEDKYDFWKRFNTPAQRLAFRDNGQYLVSCFIAQNIPLSVMIRNMTDGSLRRFNLSLPVGESLFPKINDILLSGDGRTIAAKNEQGTCVYVWSTSDGSLKKTIAIPPDQKILVWSHISNNGTIPFMASTLSTTLLDVERGALIDLSTENNNFPSDHSCSLSSDNETFLAAKMLDRTSVGFWSAHDGSYKYGFDLQQDKSLPIIVVGLNNDNTILAIAIYGKIKLFNIDAEDFEIISEITIPDELRFITYQSNLIFSHDSKTIAIIFLESVILWDVATGKLIQKIDFSHDKLVHDSSMSNFAFSPDDKILAVGDHKNIQLYKKSTAFHDALEKQQKIEEQWRSKRPRKKLSQVINESGARSSSSAPQAVVEPLDREILPVTIHTQETAQEAGVKNLNMDEPD